MKISDLLRRRNVWFARVARDAATVALRTAVELEHLGRRVAKAVLLKADHGYCYVVAVLPVEQTIDLARLSAILGGSRFEFATPQELRRLCPGCDENSLPPFGSEYGVHTVVDESLAAHAEIVFDADSRQSGVRMRFDDYRRSEQPLVLPFATQQLAA